MTFFEQYYAQTHISKNIVFRLLPIYSSCFGIDQAKVRPFDWPPEIAELDCSSVIDEVEVEFGVTLTDKDLENVDGSFDSIVRYLAERSAENS